MARPHNAPDVFRAIAHPVRRQMLEMLRKDSMTAAELARPFEMTQPSISGHLQTLRSAGLIEFRVRGTHHQYSLVRSRLKPIEEWVGVFQRRG